ncbi:hypothetical protein WJ970_11495 [Achromobacter xylosoxidans]
MLVVVGSANRVSHEQCAALQAAGAQRIQDADEIRADACVVFLQAPAQPDGDSARCWPGWSGRPAARSWRTASTP